MNNKQINNNDKAKEIAQAVTTEKNQFSSSKIDQADKFIMHPVLGLLIFAVIMLILFLVSQTYLGPLIADYLMIIIDWFASLVESILGNIGTSDFLSGLILEGIIGGFAAVIGFLPLIMVLFFLLQLLEDSGYMARVAVVMDRYFKKIGLAGKSIIPMYVGTACSIPAIMSSRTIKNEKQRKLTILLTPFVPCGAKLPVIALFITVFLVVVVG
ncbi:MAG: ferrous iron transporter B [Tenericutes bacterium]|nr:ferrous iron transporter B [Mycoplasmatota bacterium]